MNESFEVFISFKATDDRDNQTEDAVLADQVYHYLTARGLSVFFSPITLEQMGEDQFSVAIERALDISQVLVAVVGSNEAHLNAEWVRSEWNGFLNAIRSKRKRNGKIFIYAHERADHRKFPGPLADRQCFKNTSDGIERLYKFIVNALKKPFTDQPEPPTEIIPKPPIMTDIPEPGWEPEKTSELLAEIPAAACRNAWFFGNNQAICLYNGTELSIYQTSGQKLLTVPFESRIKSVRVGASTLLVSAWDGRLALLSADGNRIDYQPAGNNTYIIPGEAALFQDNVFVGFWNGNVYRLTLQDGASEVMHHKAGVHWLEAAAEELYLGDLEGGFHVYRDQHKVFSANVTSPIRFLKRLRQNVIIVAHQRTYVYALQRATLIEGDIRIEALSHFFDMDPFILVVDPSGHCEVLNEELVRQPQFKLPVVKQARPVNVDDTGVWVIFEAPNRERWLVNGQIGMYKHTKGILALAPNQTLALGDDDKVEIFSESYLSKLVTKDSA